MTVLLVIAAEQIMRGRRLLGTVTALWLGAVGITGLALALGCPIDVLDGGFGGAFGTMLLSVSPRAFHSQPLMSRPLTWAERGAMP